MNIHSPAAVDSVALPHKAALAAKHAKKTIAADAGAIKLGDVSDRRLAAAKLAASQGVAKPQQVPAAPPPSTANCCTPADIMQHWGQADSAYDLNGDGTVNFDDIIAWLFAQPNGDASGQPVQPEPTSPVEDAGPVVPAAGQDPVVADSITRADAPVPSSGPGSSALPPAGSPSTQAQITVGDLLEHWGQADSAYDVNGDGTVNFDDIIQVLQAMGETGPSGPPASPQPEAKPTAIADAAGASTAAAPDAAAVQQQPAAAPQGAGATIGSILNAWGTSDPQQDLNNDGTVNFDDILALLQRMGAPESRHAQAAPLGRERQPHPVRPHAVHAMGRLTRLANRLVDRLADEGFSSAPPANVRELVAKLELSPKQQKHVLKQIAARYPRGLGVNMSA